MLIRSHRTRLSEHGYSQLPAARNSTAGQMRNARVVMDYTALRMTHRHAAYENYHCLKHYYIFRSIQCAYLL